MHMMRSSSRRTLVAAIAVLFVAAGALTLSALLPGGDEATSEEAPLFVLTADGSAVPDSSELAEARVALSLGELERSLESPAVVVVDRSATTALSEGSLRGLVSEGHAVFGINIPLRELSALTGFVEDIRDES
jgi:hypothetical protein